jgi:transcriptional regulator of acetoin/glycerol metabolism
LQEREVLSVGATRAQPVDLRVVAATHRDLDEMAEHGRFRADLLARLNGFALHLPPLRERLEDFGLVTASILAQHAQPDTTISVEAMRLLLAYSWPLNIRELEHCLRGALAVSPSRIDVEHLPRSIREPRAAEPVVLPTPTLAPAAAAPRRLTPEQLAIREELRAVLKQHRGNISAAARHFGKERIQIRRWIKQLEISRGDIAD